MTDLESAVAEVATALEAIPVPYMLIGGLAVSSWGEVRSTLDVDVTIWTEPERLDQTVSEIGKSLKVLAKDPVSFVRRTRVLPAASSREIRIDIVFASLPAEKHIIIQRAQPKKIGGKTIQVASVEDLVFMKLASERPKDIQDSRALLRRFRKTIDRKYLEPRLKELADGLARPDILSIYHEEMD
jgi:predicted nucleotidyltransferase